MIFSMPADLPLLYDKNRRTFMLILSVLIGLLYLACISSNGVRDFIKAWQLNPEQENYVLIPYSGNTSQLENDTVEMEKFLKKSPLVKGFRKIDEQSFQRMFSPQIGSSKSWIESIPFPVFIELDMKSSAQEKLLLIENQIKGIVPDAQVYTQPRYSAEFVSSLKLTVSDLEQTGRLGYTEGITRIFVQALRQLDVNMRPLHCTDMKRETVYIKDQDIWEKENEKKTKLKNVLRMVARKNLTMLPVWQEQNPNYQHLDTQENDMFIRISLSSLGPEGKEEQDKQDDKIIRNVLKEVVLDKSKKYNITNG